MIDENSLSPINTTNDHPNGFWESQAALPSEQDLTTLRAMRWFLLILLAIGFLASTTGGMLAFLLTRNPYMLALIPTPTLLIRLAASSLLPLDERRFHLAVLKLQSRARTPPAPAGSHSSLTPTQRGELTRNLDQTCQVLPTNMVCQGDNTR